MGSSTTLFRAVAALLIASACVAGRPLPDVVEEVNATLTPDIYVTSPGDALEITFPNNPEWTQTIRIRQDGKGSLLFVGDVELVGFTMDQLDEELTTLYEESLTVAELNVRVSARAPRGVVVFGSLAGGGVLTLNDQPLSLREALGRAGGPSFGNSSLRTTLLLRWLPEEKRYTSWVIDLDTRHWDHPEALWLQSHDLVYVPMHPVVVGGRWMQNFLRLLPFPGIVLAAAA